MRYKAYSKLRTATPKGEPLNIEPDAFFDSKDVDAKDLAMFEASGACSKFDPAVAEDASDLGTGDFFETPPDSVDERTPAQKRKDTLAAKAAGK